MKKLILSLLCLFSCLTVYAQTVAVQGTIVDSDSTIWFNAHVTVTWVPNSNYPNANQYTYQGQPLTNSTALLRQTVTTNGSGVFNVTVIDSNQIQPAGSTYQFVIQSYTSAQSSVLPNIALTGSSQDVSSFIHTNITAPRFAATSGQYGGAYGYGTNEVSVVPVPGGSFFNVTNLTIEVWNGTSWQVQAIGSFCSSVNCTIQNLQTLNFNNTCETSTQAGSDFITQYLACQNSSYMATGGIITSYGYGNSNQTSNVVLPSIGTSTQPITWIMNSATKFTWNQNVGTNNNSSSCVIPISNGSKLIGMGLNGFAKANLFIGNSAVMNDFMCNLTWDSTQESFQLDGITLVGNANATKTGALLHLKNLFVGTIINNFGTYYPNGIGVQVDGGSDIVFNNAVINDGATSGQYPGALLVLNCPNRTTFNAGAIQFNGLFNPLMKINSPQNTGACQAGSDQPFGVHFYNVDWETQAATIGSFSGHETDVTPIIMNDPSDVLIDGLFLFGNRGAGQTNIVEINSNLASRGPVEINNLSAPIPLWSISDVLIKNNGGTFTTVAPQLQNMHGKGTGAAVTVGKYRWQGSNSPIGNNSIDYEDNKSFTAVTTNLFNIVPTPFVNIDTCNSGLEGQLASVTDSTSQIPGTVITTGSGTFHVQLYCNGTNWAVSAGQSTRLAQQFTICASGCIYSNTICTTTGLAWSPGGCSMGVFNWPIAFADNDYSFHCDVLTALGGGSQPVAAFTYNAGGSNQGPAGIAVNIMTATATAVQVQKIACLGVHN